MTTLASFSCDVKRSRIPGILDSVYKHAPRGTCRVGYFDLWGAYIHQISAIDVRSRHFVVRCAACVPKAKLFGQKLAPGQATLLPRWAVNVARLLREDCTQAVS